MAPIAPQDAMFLMMEAREKPAHVGGLQLFEPPEDGPPDFLARLYHGAMDSAGEMRPLFLRRPYRMGGFGPWAWTQDDRFDLEYHVRHSALAAPGRILELLALVSRLHGSLLDRNRPLWEAHLIEGVSDGRFALYTKVHHAMVDGVTAMRLLVRSMSDDPDERDMPYPWEKQAGGRGRPAGLSLPDLLGAGARAATELPGTVAGAGVAVVRALASAFDEQAAALPFRAPRTMLNVPITGARRFAAQSWSLERIRKAGAPHGATVNDMVLAMSAGALRSYLLDQDALPEQPLIAMVPVSLKVGDDGDAETGGNAVGVILCNLGTHLADPVARLDLIRASMERGKAQFEGLSAVQILMLSAMAIAPAAPAVLGLSRVDLAAPFVRPAFNVVISNVPGSREPLYWNGARMTGSYPVSVLVDGQAVNITVTSYAGSLDFGIIGCRRNVPHLQRMLTHLETELAELEA